MPPSPTIFNNFIPLTLSQLLPPPPAFNNFNLPQSPPPIFNNLILPSSPTFNNVFSKSPKKGSTFQPQHPLEPTSRRTKPKPEKVIENIDTAI